MELTDIAKEMKSKSEDLEKKLQKSVEDSEAKGLEKLSAFEKKSLEMIAEIEKKYEAKLNELKADSEKGKSELAEKIKADYSEEIKGYKEALEEVKKDHQAIEVKLNAFKTSEAEQEIKTLGHFAIDKEFIKTAKSKKPADIDISLSDISAKSVFGSMFNTKDLSSASTSMGPLTRSTQTIRPEIYAPNNEAMHVRSLIPNIPVQGNLVYFVTESGRYNMWDLLGTSYTTGGASLVMTNAAGCFAGQTLYITDGTNTDSFTVVSVDKATNTLTIGVADVTHNYTVGASTYIYGMTFTPISELGDKPQFQLFIEEHQETIKTIPAHITNSLQILDDAPRLMAYINNRGPRAIAEVVDYQILYGDGVGNNFRGLLGSATTLDTVLWSSLGAGSYALDAVFDCIALTRVQGVMSYQVLINPVTHNAYFNKQKDDIGQYVTRVSEINFVQTTAINQGDLLIGDFGMAVELYVRDDMSMRAAYEHDKNFTQNKVTFLFEMRLGMGIVVPEALVILKLDSQP